MQWLILLPFFSFLGIFFNLSNIYTSIREAIVFSLIIFFVLITLSTEFISLFHLLNTQSIAIFWTFVGIIVLVRILKGKLFIKNHSVFDNFEKVSITLFTLLLILLLIISIIHPSTNWDSMTYHLSRVMHWQQNKSLEYYASHIERQIVFQGFAEYFILHTVLLTKNDYFVNIPQWLSFIGLIATASLITSELGVSRKGQLLTVFLLIAIPIALLQAPSTQNDLVASFLIVFSFYSFIKFRKMPNVLWAFYIGTGIGLATLTKGTSYFFILPLVVSFSWLLIKKWSKKILLNGILISFMVILLNFGFFARNVELLGTPLPVKPTKEISVNNEKYGFLYFSSNLLKSYIPNLSADNIDYTNFFENVVRGLHKVAQIDIDDKRTSFTNFEMPYGQKLYSQDYAPSPLHAWAFLILLPIWYVFREKLSQEFKYTFVWGLGGFLLLIFMLKWQPFGVRFQIPFWTWVSVWIAYTIDVFWQAENKLKKWVFLVLYLLLSLKGVFYLYNSANLALKEEKNVWNTPREELYFLARPNLYQDYKKLVEQIIQTRCKKIGLILKLDDWEYPLWKMLHNRGFYPEIKHIQVENITKSLEDKNFQPCIVVEIDNHKDIAKIR